MSLREAMVIVNHKPAGFSFLIENQKLVGMLTDGDIRRAILNGFGLGQNLKELDLPMCKFAFDTDSYEVKLSKMNGKIRVLPIVNQEMELVDYFQYDVRNHFPIAEPRLKGNELQYLTDGLLSTWISSASEYINRFEKKFASYIGMGNGIAVSNETVVTGIVI
jgi:perosamine synthetase